MPIGRCWFSVPTTSAAIHAVAQGPSELGGERPITGSGGAVHLPDLDDSTG